MVNNNNNNNIWIVALIIILILAFFGGFRFMNFHRGSYIGFYGLNWIFGIIALIAAIWVIYDVLVNNKKLSDGMKVVWIIFAIVFSIISAVIYYFLGRDGKNDLFKNKKF
jgi:uncharacterized BrkB/YihY/UPF0761 family membrane protein